MPDQPTAGPKKERKRYGRVLALVRFVAAAPLALAFLAVLDHAAPLSGWVGRVVTLWQNWTRTTFGSSIDWAANYLPEFLRWNNYTYMLDHYILALIICTLYLFTLWPFATPGGGFGSIVSKVLGHLLVLPLLFLFWPIVFVLIYLSSLNVMDNVIFTHRVNKCLGQVKDDFRDLSFRHETISGHSEEVDSILDEHKYKNVAEINEENIIIRMMNRIFLMLWAMAYIVALFIISWLFP